MGSAGQHVFRKPHCCRAPAARDRRDRIRRGGAAVGIDTWMVDAGASSHRLRVSGRMPDVLDSGLGGYDSSPKESRLPDLRALKP